MCGITGILGSNSEPHERLRDAAERMSLSLGHRGPDDCGIMTLQPDHEHWHTLVLTHRRLSIIDLSEQAHQPMSTPDGRYSITYNGEIYNYRELRTQIQEQHPQIQFRTQSDTEVILQLYAMEGAACLQKLRGMFAFAIWDQQRKELFFARDRFGMKPFYYTFDSNLFIFASEIKSLFASGYVKAAIDSASQIAYLYHGSISAPNTFFDQVKALEPGSYGMLSGKKLTIHPYWSLSKVFEQNDGGEVDTRQAASLIQESLIESVNAHMVSDVPVGVFLSGGIDSSAILASVRAFHLGPLQTFSVVFPGTPWDESILARQAAKYYGTKHLELKITYQDFCESLDDFFSAMDQPTMDGLNTYFVARAARKAGFKVALSGIGGDELLGGYSSFVKVPRLRNFAELVRSTPGLRNLLTYATDQLHNSRIAKLHEMLSKAPLNIGEIWAAYRSIFSEKQIKNLLPNSDSFNSANFSNLPQETFRAISFCEMAHFMIPQLLRDSDVFTMHYGLELRTPFVDHVFLKRVLEIGQWSKGSAFSHKAALFGQLNGFLPPAQLRNRKMGFTLPIEVWLKEALRSDPGSPVAQIWTLLGSRPEYAPYVSGFLKNRVHWSRVWNLYVLEKFRNIVA